MNFQEFAEFLNNVEQVQGRNAMTENLAAFLKTTTPEEAKHLMYFLLGRLAPKFVPLEFNFSEKMVLKALSQDYLDNPKRLLGELGDIGLVVYKLKGEFKSTDAKPNSDIHKLESIMEVYDFLVKLAKIEGKGSQEEKIKLYKYIVDNLDPLSSKYISRIIVGDLRIGFSEKTILDAFSWFITGDKSLRKDIDIAFGARADVGELAKVILETPKDKIVEVLENIKIMPLTPVASKLVEREASAQAVWERMPNCIVQPKLDGLRGQIHLSEKREAAIYSRNMESLTDQFPEIIEGVKALKVDSIILDSEIIGFDSASDSYRTYQDTMKRRRKFDIESFSKDIPVRAMCFDVLYLNGEDLTTKPVEERVEILRKLIEKSTSALTMLETEQMQTEAELEAFFEEKVGAGLEGIIAKQIGTNYDPGTRNFKWIKLKANTKSELVDTIDVVVMGYFYGQGVRSKNGFGALLAGVYNAEDDKYYSIGKVGSGFKDEEAPKMFEDLTKLKYSEDELKDKLFPDNYVVEKILYPDVWVKPKIVMEIVADEITRSPSHTAARGLKANVKGDDSEKGLSIRFPRLKKWMRDKDLPNSVQEIVRMYELRKGK
ncbi:MAG: ATP-dependent DNA ligase [Candidatus Dojkabacteria bacterium]